MLFTNLNESFEKKDSSLNQGSNFNGMQHKIIQEAMPKFPLIEKTSMPNITYMKEPLANMEKKDQKQKQQKSLSQIDKEEFKKLNELEAKFSKKLSEYVTIYKSRSDEAMKPECNSNSGVANSDCKSDKNNTDTSNAKLKLLNEQLMSLSREMWNQTQKIQGNDLKLQKQIAEKREKLNKNIKKLAAHQTNFNKLNESRTTLTGQLEDTSLRSNTEYMHYMAWFVAATTIGAIAFQKLLNN